MIVAFVHCKAAGKCHTPTAADVCRALTAADDTFPRGRGVQWRWVFDRVMTRLGYFRPHNPQCVCGCLGVRAECGYVKACDKRPPATRRTAPYVDPPGTHRHECRACGCVWAHHDSTASKDTPDAEFDEKHKCPECGVWCDFKCENGRPPQYVSPIAAKFATPATCSVLPAVFLPLP